MKSKNSRNYFLVLFVSLSITSYSQIGIGDMLFLFNYNSEDFQKFYTNKGYKLNKYIDDETTTGIDVFKTLKGNINQITLYTRWFDKGRSITYNIVDDSNLFLKFKEELPKYDFTFVKNEIKEGEKGNYELFGYINNKSGYELEIYIVPNKSEDQKWVTYEIGLTKIQRPPKLYSYSMNDKGDSVSLKISNEDYEWLKNSQIITDWKSDLTKEFWGEYENKRKEFEQDVVNFYLKKCLVEIMTNVFFGTTKIEGNFSYIFGKGSVRRNQSGITIEVLCKSVKDEKILFYQLKQVYKYKYGKWDNELLVEQVK